MTEDSPITPKSGEFSLPAHSNSVRRARPPDANTVDQEGRIPLRVGAPKKLAKRESRLGLRGIFGRTRPSREGGDSEESTSSNDLLRPGGFRASLAEFSSWPYGQHNSHSDVSLPNPPVSDTARLPTSNLGSQASSGRMKHNAAFSPRAPLFQAYPQAVKHATLPACTTPMETLLRLHAVRTASEGLTTGTMELDEDNAKKPEKGKRRHQRSLSRSNLDWTSKVYALVTSGYLLQYAADGPFDRLPERVLQLTKDSAAFASDLIPGKHWVLQVSSIVDSEGNPATSSRSLFSKLALRSGDKRNASDFLLVFESAEDMDNWLAILRREIESLGGKKKLSETGRPSAEVHSSTLRREASHRTLVVRDPDRFSRVITRDFSYSPGTAAEPYGDHPLEPPAAEFASDFALDDASTSGSHYSSDGQHLDNLRDSSNRLSFISSGQRTILTSAGSSPAGSPLRASFSSFGDDQKSPPSHGSQPEVRLRPNAQAIASRRQSMQTFIPAFEGVEPSTGLQTSIAENHEVAMRQSIPNFSVPHSANKRFSSLRVSSLETVPDQPPSPERQDSSPRPAKRTPPTALALSRPLSVVLDQPSPISPSYSLGSQGTKDTRGSGGDTAAPTNIDVASPFPIVRVESPSKIGKLPFYTSSLARRRQQAHAAEPKEDQPLPTTDGQQTIARLSNSPRMNHDALFNDTLAPSRAPNHGARFAADDLSRTVSTFDGRSTDRRLSASYTIPSASQKRASFIAESATFASRRSFGLTEEMVAAIDDSLPSPQYRPSVHPSVSPIATGLQNFLTVEQQGKMLLNRKSMPQLTEGPPPLPPPTCALPPLPKKHPGGSPNPAVPAEA